MDEKSSENWRHYSAVWRNVLGCVLQWPEERINHLIEQLRQEMETGAHDPAEYGFFFDPPLRYLWRILVGDLYDKTKGDEAGPYPIYQRLERAISGGLNHWELDKESFDWNEARERYQNEHKKIKDWLTSLGP